MAPFFFIFTATMLSTVQILPRPSTIIMIKMTLPLNSGGATAAMTFFFVVIIRIMPTPASRNPMDWVGRNMVFSAAKSQISAAYSSFQVAFKKPARKY